MPRIIYCMHVILQHSTYKCPNLCKCIPRIASIIYCFPNSSVCYPVMEHIVLHRGSNSDICSMKGDMQAFMTRFLRSPVVSTIPIPKQEPNELLVKVAYVSLNPTDCVCSPRPSSHDQLGIYLHPDYRQTCRPSSSPK